MTDNSDQASAGWVSPYDTNHPYNRHHFWTRQHLAKLRTNVMVKVVAVTAGQHPYSYTVDVQPLVNQVDGQGNKQEHGTVYGIPMLSGSGGNGAVVVKPKVGDMGLMAIQDRDTSAAIAANGQANPGSSRMHSMSDGIYLGGFGDLNSTQGYTVQDENGITINSPHAATITAQGAPVSITASHGVNITGNTSVTGNISATGSISGGAGTTPPVLLGITRSAISSNALASYNRFLTSDGAPWIHGSPSGPMAIQDSSSQWWQIDISELCDITWFGAVGDYSLLTQTGTDNATAIAAALAASSSIYVPAGNFLFTNIAVASSIFSANVTGPGDLYYNSGSTINQVGGTLRTGINDPSGVVGVPDQLSQGGILLGGEGPGTNGMLFCNQQNSWTQMQPTRTGTSAEFQIYTNGHLGIGSVTIGGNTITATSGDFSSSDIAVGDVIAFGKTLYLIASKPTSTTITVTTTGGGGVSFAASVSATWRHVYWYCDGNCSTSGTTVNWLSGDYFIGFAAAWAATQATITINGTKYQCSTHPSKTQITITSSAGTQTNVPFTQKVLPNSLEVALLRIQGLAGGNEEDFAIYQTLQGAINIETSFAGSGGYLPLIFRTGPNYDNTSTGTRDHFEISEDGRIGIGFDYNTVGWPSANTKVNVFRDPLVAASTNGSTIVSMLAINTTYNGSNSRVLELGSYNNFNAGFIQGWSTYGSATSAIALQPQGGAINIRTGYLTGGLTTVFGTTPGISIASSNDPIVLGNYTADAFGQRLDFVKSRSATINGQTIVQSGDSTGSINFAGSDGTNVYNVANISGIIDGSPSAGTSMPGKIQFATTASGATTITNRVVIDNGGNIKPVSDNAYTCGASGLRWSAVWAANGTIQTSDAREKTDVAPSSLGLGFILSLNPVSYKWAVGRNEVEETNEAGEPTKLKPRPGNRTHWGLLAQQVKEVCDKANVDFGGWILTDPNDPNSQQGLRYDQLVAPLIKAVQELASRIEAIEEARK